MKPLCFMELGCKPTKTLGSAIAEGKVNRMDDLISRDKLIINMNDAKAILHMFQFPKEQIDVAEIVADAMIYNVRKAPTVDAVPVVRCKDCKYCEPVYDLIGLAQDDLVYCKNTRCICKLNWFCADGDRKDSDFCD